MKPTLEIKQIEITALKPFPGNPRKHGNDVDGLVRSIEQFGWTNPILAQSGTNRVIAGHGRLLAAQKAGLKTVPVIFLDLDDVKAKAYTIADNRLAEMSEWDDAKLKELLVDLDTGGFDLSFTGFSEDDLAKLISNGVGSEMVEPKMWERQQMLAAIEKTIPDGNGVTLAAHVINKATAMRQFEKLCNGYDDGYWISALFNLHRLDTPTKNSMSYAASFNEPAKRKEMARFMLDMQNCDYTPAYFVKGCAVGVGGISYVNEFRPWLARDIYKKFCKAGSRVLDPCAGWGGRMIGFHAAQLGGFYLGCEPAQKTHRGLIALGDFLAKSNATADWLIEHRPFEDADIKGKFDFALTSPPYFDTERYSMEQTQSWVKYKTYGEWERGFLNVLVAKTMKALKPGAVFLLNVGNNVYNMTASLRKIVAALDLDMQITKDFTLAYEGSLGDRSANVDESKGEQFVVIKRKGE